MKRFHYVVAPGSRIVHRVYNKTAGVIEGDRTACGRIVPLGWSLRAELSRWTRLRRCKKCEKDDVR